MNLSPFPDSLSVSSLFPHSTSISSSFPHSLFISPDVGNIDDQCRGPSIEERDHLAELLINYFPALSVTE